MKIERRSLLGGMLLLPTALVGACRAEAAPLSIYSILPRNVNDALAAGWRSRTGQSVRFWRADQAELKKRVDVELSQNVPTFDLIEADTTFLTALAGRAGVIAPLPDPIICLGQSRGIAVSRSRAACLAWNTAKVNAAIAPRSYAELLDPRWRGQIVVVTGAAAWFFGLHKRWGTAKAKEYFDALARVGVRAAEGHSLTAELLANGEFAICPTMYEYKIAAMKQAGQPVDMALAPPVVVELSGWAINAKSSLQGEAQRFIAFCQGEGATILRHAGMVPGALAEFQRAYPQSRAETVTVEELAAPGLYEEWADRLRMFLKQAERY